MNKLLDFLIPRFITEDMVLKLDGDMYIPVGSVRYADPEDVFDGVIAMRAFSFLGFCFFARPVGNIRPWGQ